MTEQPIDDWARRARETLDRIPGYRGYRLKEERRNADRRVREAVARAYAEQLARVEAIGRELATARRLGDIEPVERASQAIRHYIDRIRTATPGYGGIFGDRDIDGVALDQLRLFDEGLLLGVDELREAIDGLETAHGESAALAPAARAVASTMERQVLRLNARDDVIETGRAASGDTVASLLLPASATAPHELFEAQPGDAVSILGDDFLIDARIAVDGRPLSFRVLRIGKQPESWLMVPASPDQPILRLDAAEPAEMGLGIADTAMNQIQAGTGDGEVTTDRGSNGLRAVRYALLEDNSAPERKGLVLDWDGERQAYIGSAVEPLDIEVFRRAEAAG